MEKEEIDELCKKYKKSEKLILLLIKICKDYNIKENKKQINNFFKNDI